MIKPTNGRVVLFTPHASDPIAHRDRTKPLAATVAHVWGDRCINIGVLNSNGCVTPKTSVPLLQDDDAKPEDGFFCTWMPYQVGQAAKAEALESAANSAKAASGPSEDAYLRRWAVETAMQAARDQVDNARQDVKAYAEKLRAWVSGEASAA